MYKRLIVLSSVLAISGCAAIQPPQARKVERLPFNEAEYAQRPKTGTGAVSGQAFLTTKGGDVRTAAGNDVVLNPSTSLSDQWMTEICAAGGEFSTAPDPRYAASLRTTVADGSGRFGFTNVPPGNYYVVTRVVWSIPGARTVSRTQGGILAAKITVADGGKADIVLSQRNICRG